MAGLAAAPGAQLLAYQRRKAEPPDTDSLVADLDAPLQEKFCYVAKSELVTQVSEDGEQHDISGNWRALKGEPARSLNRRRQVLQEKVR